MPKKTKADARNNMHFKRRIDITYKPDVAAKPGLLSKKENAVRNKLETVGVLE
jgi:hypothetical protein